MHEQAAEQSLQEEKPRGQAPATQDTSAQQEPPRRAVRPGTGSARAAAARAGARRLRLATVAARATPRPTSPRWCASSRRSNSVDLGSLKGTGVGGRIRKQDVLDAAEAARKAPERTARRPRRPRRLPAAGGAASTPALSPKRGTTEKMSRLRKVIAAAHGRVPAGLRPAHDGRRGGRHQGRRACVTAPSATSRPARASSSASCRSSPSPRSRRSRPTRASTPRVNGDEITYHGSENLGVAVDTERGLLVPVIQDAGDLNIAGLARKIADLAERTRTNKVSPDELGGGTFTLTNTGSRGALFDTPIINQPNVAILGTGAVVKRPVVVKDADGGESIAIRSMVYLALSYDHRVVDGADAARFLVTMKTRLEEGAFEASLGL